MDSLINCLITVLGENMNDKSREHVYDQIIPEIHQLDDFVLKEMEIDDPVFEKSYSNFIKSNS